MTQTFRLLFLLFSILCVSLFFPGCREQPPLDTPWYGEATMHGGAVLPFIMVLRSHGDGPPGFFLVGEEQTEIPEVRITPDSVLCIISEYNAALRFAWDGEALRGVYERYRTDTTGFPVVARTSRPFYAEPAPTSNPLAGSFRVFAGDSRNPDTSSSAVFWTRKDSVFGTIVAPSGDDGLYAGVQSGDTVRIGRFNGWQALMIEFIRDGMEWKGSQYVRQNPPASIRLSPRLEAQPAVPADKLARAIAPRKGFSFSGITPEGDTLSNLSPRFSGKALIIDIMGTWCHNCLDAAPVLETLRREFGPRGLEVVSLAFELTDDPVAAGKNISIFRDRHDVTYPILFSGDLSRENVASRIRAQIENFGGYPTSIFVNGEGIVLGVHTGFRGPGTGPSYQSEVAHFRRMAESLVGQ